MKISLNRDVWIDSIWQLITQSTIYDVRNYQVRHFIRTDSLFNSIMDVFQQEFRSR